MGEEIQNIHLRRLQGRLGDIVYQLTRVQFSPLAAPNCWSPAINAYLCSDQIVLCVDLAGVEKDRLDLKVEPRRLVLRGRREPPEPQTDAPAVQILAMEIDYGPFERGIGFPADVETSRVRAEQQNGLLWVYLPLRAQS
jgi:HSP20 family protein